MSGFGDLPGLGWRFGWFGYLTRLGWTRLGSTWWAEDVVGFGYLAGSEIYLGGRFGWVGHLVG